MTLGANRSDVVPVEPIGSGEEPPWPDALPLREPGALRPVPPVPLDALPSEIRPWLEDSAERIGCPIEFLIVGDLVARSSLAARGCAIQPKRVDDWTVIPNTWGAIVGTPGAMKSPAFAEALRFVREFEREVGPANDAAREAHEHAVAVAKAQRATNLAAIRKELGAGATQAAVTADKSLVVSEPPPPALMRFVVNEPSVEALQCLIVPNRCVLVFRDELAGWLAGLSKQGQEQARAAYLELWDGSQPTSIDRIGRGHMSLEGSVAVLGGIQPGPLRRYLADVDRSPAGDDGMLQRFQAIVWPDKATLHAIDREPNLGARERAADAYARTRAASESAEGMRTVRFDAEAQDRFDDWLRDVRELMGAGDVSETIEAALSKRRSFVPSIALLSWLADGSPGDAVGLEYLERAIVLSDFFLEHGLRVLAITDTSGRDAYHVAEKVLGRDDPYADVTKRQVSRWLNSDARRAAAVVDDLTDRCIVRPLRSSSGPKGGRPPTAFAVNPRWVNEEWS